MKPLFETTNAKGEKAGDGGGVFRGTAAPVQVQATVYTEITLRTTRKFTILLPLEEGTDVTESNLRKVSRRGERRASGVRRFQALKATFHGMPFAAAVG
jgi:hypothetical protein